MSNCRAPIVAAFLLGIACGHPVMGQESVSEMPPGPDTTTSPETPDSAALSGDSAPARGPVTPGGDRLGAALAVIPDLNGDGRADVLVGAVGVDSGADNAGAVYVLAGHSGDTIRVHLGERRGDAFGARICVLPDLDQDGISDFAVTAPGWDLNDSTARDAGKLYVISGRSGQLLTEATGDGPRQRFGISLESVVDPGGGQPRLAVGEATWRAEPEATVELSVVWIISATDGSRIRMYKSDFADDGFGMSLAAAGDLDNDGVTDLLVGAYRDSKAGMSAGAAYVFSGRTGAVLHSLLGETVFSQFGYAVAGGMDLTGDGNPDFLIGARFYDGESGRSGRLYLYSGRDARLIRKLDAVQAGEQFGTSIEMAPDRDGDLRAELLIGAVRTHRDDDEVGTVYVLSGATGTVLWQLAGEGDGHRFGEAVAPAPDVDGDGIADVIVGASGHDGGGMQSGRVYAVSTRATDILWTATGTSTLAKVAEETRQPLRSLESLESTGQQYEFPVYDTSEVDAAPIIRRSVPAAYPVEAISSGLTGWVYVKILVLPDGSPGEIEIENDSGLGPEFRSAAITAAEQWSFLAASREGQDVACWAVFEIGFAPPVTPRETSADSGAGAADSGAMASEPADSAVADSSQADSDTLKSSYESYEVDQVPQIAARVDPQYPAAAKLAGDTGTVQLRILVDSTGGVADAQLVSVSVRGKGFEAAALAAAKRGRYDPGRLGDRAVNVWIDETVEFRDVPSGE